MVWEVRGQLLGISSFLPSMYVLGIELRMEACSEAADEPSCHPAWHFLKVYNKCKHFYQKRRLMVFQEN